MEKLFIKGLVAAFVGSLMMVGSAMALQLDYGTKITMVDGNNDTNVTVNMGSVDIWDGYYLRYSVNGGNWLDVTGWGYDTFTGGDVLDFGLFGSNDSYILSNDFADNNFSATMDFGLELDPSNSQQPIMTSSYYQLLGIAWHIGDDRTYSFSGTIGVNGQGSNDGFAPVPEPATMLLFGTGLIGLAGIVRKKKIKQ